MRFYAALAAGLLALVLVGGVSQSRAANFYWDTNGTDPGAGAVPDGVWDTSTANWQTTTPNPTPPPDDIDADPTGVNTPGVWVADKTAVFSAGSDATGPYTVTLVGTQFASGITFEDGAATITGDPLTLTTAHTITVLPSVTGTINSVIDGTVGLTKADTGTLILSGANIYSGGTVLNGGTTRITADNNLGVTASNLTFNAATLRTDAAIASFTHDIVMTGTGTVNTNGNDSTFSGVFTGSGNFTKSGAGVLTLSGNSTTYGGSLTIASNGGTLKVTNSGAFGVAGTASTAQAVVLNTNGTLELTDGVNIPDRVSFNSGSGSVIRKTGSGTTIMTGGVTFGVSGQVIADSGTLQLGGAVSPAYSALSGAQATFGGAGNIVTVATGGGNVNSNLAIASQMTKIGAGMMTLNSVNGVNGAGNSQGWKILGGVLAFNSDGTTADNTAYNLGRYPGTFDADHLILDGGTLRSNAQGQGTNFVSPNRGIQLGPNGGTVDVFNALNNNATPTALALIYASGDTATVVGSGGKITMTSGTTAATLTKAGPGEFRVQGSGTASYTFTQLKVVNGLYRIGSFSTNSVQQSTETGFGAAPSVPTADAIILDGGGIGQSLGITLHDNRGITVTNNGGFINCTGGGLVMPATSLSKLTGSGKLTITGTTLAGLSLLNNLSDFDGALDLNALFTMGAGLSLNLKHLEGPTAGLGRITVASGQMLTFGRDDANTSYNGRISGAGGFTKEGIGTFLMATEEYANSGPTNINAGIIKFGDSLAGLSSTSLVTIASLAKLDMNSINDTIGALAGDGEVINNSGATGLTLAGTHTATFNGTIGGTSNLIINKASGVQTLAGANTYGGATTITAGTLQLGASGVIPDGSAVTANGTFDMNNFGETIGSLAGSGSVTNGGNLTTGGNNGSTTFSGVFSGVGSFTKVGTGAQTLSGPNTYDGGTNINAGRLQFAATNSMPLNGNVTADTGATLAVNVGGGSEWTNGPSGGGTLGGLIAGVGGQGTPDQVTWNSNSILGIDTTNAGGTFSYSDVIGSFRAGSTREDVGLNKLGTGTLELSGANTYSGATTVSAGKLFANTVGGSSTGTGAVAVNSTATLGGTGIISGAVSVNSGGTLAPGADNIGLLATGDMTFNTGTFAVELNSLALPASGADRVNVTGGLNIIDGSKLTLTDIAATSTLLTNGMRFSLIAYSGSWDNGLFKDLSNQPITDGGSVTVGANTYTVDYNDTTQGDNFTGGSFTNFVSLVVNNGVLGDYDNTGTVDASDYVMWRTIYEEASPTALPYPATEVGPDGLGVTNIDDLDRWAARFNNTTNPPSTVNGLGSAQGVPEPASIALVLLGIAAFATGRRLRKV